MKNRITTKARLCFILMLAGVITSHASFDRSKGWYGDIPVRPEDERFMRIYVEDATLYHDDGSEVNLWGVNFQSAMIWEWRRSFKDRKWGKKWDSSYYDSWKAVVDRGFDEIEQLGCEVIRIHLCPADFADGEGNLIENDWLDMLDYTMAECYRRGVYVNLSLLNFLGDHGRDKILSLTLKEHIWEAIVVPQKIEASEHYIRQLVNRRNPHDGNRPYRENPAWIVAEIMNEPMWPKGIPSKEKFPDGMRVFESWLKDHGKTRSMDAWAEFKTETIKDYIDRMDALLYELRVPAVSCWNLYWIQAPKHQGPEAYQAAAESTIPVVSFASYIGQNDVYGKEHRDLSMNNYMPFLQSAYDNIDWQGWVRDDRFKGKKAIIVYEYETWCNQSTYMYPAMAKYFRAQGAQIATMWTYYLNEDGYYLPKTHAHNLNLISTPRKAASFLVAEQVFKTTPRFSPYSTTAKDADRFGNAALSHPLDLSAYADENIIVHTGDVDHGFIDLPSISRRIVGYGNSPFVTYEGTGLYFLDAVFEDGKYEHRWKLKVMPNAKFDEEGQALVDYKTSSRMTLQIPGMDKGIWKVYRMDGEERLPVRTSGSSNLSFDVEPGEYEVIRSL